MFEIPFIYNHLISYFDWIFSQIKSYFNWIYFYELETFRFWFFALIIMISIFVKFSRCWNRNLDSIKKKSKLESKSKKTEKQNDTAIIKQSSKFQNKEDRDSPKANESLFSLQHDELSVNHNNCFDGLPSECLELILEFLSIVDICHLSRTCKTLNEFCKSDNLWSRHYLYNWPKRKTSSQGGWKQQYAIKYKVEQNWKQGEFQALSLAGHLTSVYCLQYDWEDRILVRYLI